MSTDGPEPTGSRSLGRCPLSQAEVIEHYFMEHRAKLIDIAAFLDRLERSSDFEAGSEDEFRIAAFRRALAVLTDGQPERARRVLETFSDFTTEVPVSADGLKGASGAAPVGTSQGEG